MTASKLVRPDARYKDSVIEALYEYHSEGRHRHITPGYLQENFEEFVEMLRTERRMLHKPCQEWVEIVPETVLWLVKDDMYIGSTEIRHRLNWHLEKWGGHLHFQVRPGLRGKGFGKKILRKALPIAHHLGVDKALVTIAPEASRAARIIETQGGEFWDETPATDCFPARKRYWIACG